MDLDLNIKIDLDCFRSPLDPHEFWVKSDPLPCLNKYMWDQIILVEEN